MDTYDVCLLTPTIPHWINIWACRLTGAVLIVVIILMKETRSTIILTRLAKKIRKQTGDHRYRARAEDEEGSLTTLIYVSCTRPLCMSFPPFMSHYESLMDDCLCRFTVHGTNCTQRQRKCSSSILLWIWKPTSNISRYGSVLHGASYTAWLNPSVPFSKIYTDLLRVK